MTTIAVNLVEGTASSDSRLQGEDCVPMLCTKMWVTKWGDLFLESGDAPGSQLVMEWAQHRLDPKKITDELIEHSLKPDVDFSCLLIRKDGVVFHIDDGLTPAQVYDDKFTLGSGRDFARGAMDAGATTAEAVAIAIAHDGGSGAPVQTTLTPFKRKGPN